MHPFAAVAYDVTYAYAFAADALVSAGSEVNGVTMLESLKQVNFTGVTGQFNFNEFVRILCCCVNESNLCHRVTEFLNMIFLISERTRNNSLQWEDGVHST